MKNNCWSARLLGLFVLGFVASLRAQPMVVLEQNERNVRIDQVGFRACDIPKIDASIAPEEMARAMGRTYGLIFPEGIAYPEPRKNELLEASSRRGSYFDVWNLVASLGQDDRRAIALEFVIEAKGLKSCWLSLGFNDRGIVFVDRQPVWGMGGGREHCLGQNMVPIALHDGRALVSLVTWKAGDWSGAPKDHYADEWAVNLSLCPTVEAAWATYTANNYHFIDSPVVKSFGDIRFNVRLEGREEVSLYNLKGEKIQTGRITADLKLKWDAETVTSPFVGLLEIGGQLAEAVVVEGESSVDAMAARLIGEGTRQIPDWNAWKFRCDHLLKPDYAKSRDHWWARKLALSFCMAGLQVKFDPAVRPFGAWGSARIGFHSYVSEIDGTVQHYRALVGSPKDGRSRPLAVYLPGAPMPVRPFLESYSVADLNEAEMLARLADSCGVDLLWPGNVDIDYGGNFTRRWIDEAIRAFGRDFPASGYRPIYLIGSCAAGSAALGYTETYGGTDGIVFWSPVVSREAYRWPVRDKDWMPMLPGETMIRESTAANLAKLKPIPLFCVFDISVKGHGDREGTKALCDALAKFGGNVVQRWIPNPDPVLQWGVRASDSELEWLNWIAENAPGSGPRTPRQSLPAAKTIKDALLQGYAVGDPGTEAGRAWLDRWTSIVAQCRGPISMRGNAKAAVHVRIEPRTREQMIALFAENSTQSPGLRPLPADLDSLLKDYSEIWCVRLTNAQPATVDVLHHGAERDGPVPAFDLFREGSCRSVAWGYRNGAWEFLQVWLD